MCSSEKLIDRFLDSNLEKCSVGQAVWVTFGFVPIAVWLPFLENVDAIGQADHEGNEREYGPNPEGDLGGAAVLPERVQPVGKEEGERGEETAEANG